MFELAIAAAMIFKTDERILSSCCVLTKVESCGRDICAFGTVGIVGIAAVQVGCVRIAFWAVRIRKIHRAASKIVSIECGRDGEWCGYLIWRRRSICDCCAASKTRRYCWDCSRGKRKSCATKCDEIVLYRRWNAPRSCSDRIPLKIWSETRHARSSREYQSMV